MNQTNRAQFIATAQRGGKQQSSCAGCMQKGRCFPGDIPKTVDFEGLVQRLRPLHKGEHIYRQEQAFSAIYMVRAGAFKAYRISDQGEEQITQFYFQGDIFGIDGLSRDRYATSVLALETSAVCAIPFDKLGSLSSRVPALQQHIYQLLSAIILGNQELIVQLGKHSAERRIASFLERISRGQAERGLSARLLRLPMTRTDISGYLGLTVETVSRIFSRLQQIGLLKAAGRELEILDMNRLHELASCGERCGATGAAFIADAPIPFGGFAAGGHRRLRQVPHAAPLAATA